ncbi:MAG: redoxin domain-containing protein [Gammaproteobacteria bacterium]|nr:redoxin domain-containing protein [Gammaproteobacteria bacterium]
MKHSRFALLGVLLGLALGANATELKVGDKAPAFNLESTHGGTYQLGEKPVVLAWFPKAYTRGCTIECKSLAENGHLIEAFDVDYFMVSCDAIEDNKGFAAENNAKFPLLSDPTKETATAYGVLNERGVPSRHNYYIAADGTILAIDRIVNPATAAEDIAARLAELDIPKVAKEAAEADTDT